MLTQDVRARTGPARWSFGVSRVHFGGAVAKRIVLARYCSVFETRRPSETNKDKPFAVVVVYASSNRVSNRASIVPATGYSEARHRAVIAAALRVVNESDAAQRSAQPPINYKNSWMPADHSNDIERTNLVITRFYGGTYLPIIQGTLHIIVSFARVSRVYSLQEYLTAYFPRRFSLLSYKCDASEPPWGIIETVTTLVGTYKFITRTNFFNTATT